MDSEQHAGPPAWARRHRRVLLASMVVLVVGGIARIWSASTTPDGLYFPDSWCYVIRIEGPPCMAHSPAVGWWWSVLTFGVRSATAVLWLQALVGLATAQLILLLLSRLARLRWALVAALVFALLPAQLLMERSFMTETLEIFFIVVALCATWFGLATRSPWRAAGAVLAASLAIGCGLSVHTALLIPGSITALVVAALVLTRVFALDRRRWARATACVGIPVVMAFGLVAPALPEAASYHRWYGTWTTDVAQGTFLLTRWAPLVSCSVPKGTTPRARAEIKAACTHHRWGKEPGITQWLTWTSPFTYRITGHRDIEREQVARTESQLRAKAIGAIAADPGAFSSQMLASLLWQVGGPPVDDLWQYRVPRQQKFVFSRGWIVPNFTEWFGERGIPQHPGGNRALIRAASGTTRSGQVLLWLAMAGGLWRLLRRLWRRRVSELPAEPVALTPRTGMGMVSAALVATSMAAVAFGTYPVFRYFAPIVPALLILLALVPPQPADQAPSPAPDRPSEPELG